MENSKIILDLMNRLIELEERVGRLETTLAKETSRKKNIKRTEARRLVMDRLRDHSGNLKNFRVASREEGSGIKFEYNDDSDKTRTVAFKFYSSNVSESSDGVKIIWFAINKSVIDQIEESKKLEEVTGGVGLKGLIFFAIDEKSREEMLLIIPENNVKNLIEAKGKDTHDKKMNYHFYFEKTDEGTVVETRNKDGRKIDVTACANDYGLLEKFYIEGKVNLLNAQA